MTGINIIYLDDGPPVKVNPTDSGLDDENITSHNCG